MGEPFIGEIKMVGFNFAPVDWELCNGQLVSISEYDALYSLIGTTYGGDGVSTFALPNLQSRIPIHKGTSPSGVTRVLGESGGQETVTLTTQQLPVHTHVPAANTGGNPVNDPSGKVWTGWTGAQYSTAGPTGGAVLNAAAMEASGGGQPHENRPPYLTINFIICVYGIYPSRP